MRRFYWLLMIAWLLAACTGSKTTATATEDPQAIMTAVQLTVQYNLTQIRELTPSATATPTITETVAPTTPAPTEPQISGTPAPTDTKAPLADKAELVSQSVPDHSKFNPGEPFKVTWTFKNVGTTTWSTEYTAKFWSDSLMGSPETIKFTKEVKPGNNIDITMNFIAPKNIGSAKSSWWLQNPDGENFFPFFIAIEVVSALPTPPTHTPTATVEPSMTATESPTTIVTSSP